MQLTQRTIRYHGETYTVSMMGETPLALYKDGKVIDWNRISKGFIVFIDALLNRGRYF